VGRTTVPCGRFRLRTGLESDFDFALFAFLARVDEAGTLRFARSDDQRDPLHFVERGTRLVAVPGAFANRKRNAMNRLRRPAENQNFALAVAPLGMDVHARLAQRRTVRGSAILHVNVHGRSSFLRARPKLRVRGDRALGRAWKDHSPAKSRRQTAPAGESGWPSDWVAKMCCKEMPNTRD